jgi:hypothetical protein
VYSTVDRSKWYTIARENKILGKLKRSLTIADFYGRLKGVRETNQTKEIENGPGSYLARFGCVD